MKKPDGIKSDAFREELKKAILKIIHDPTATTRDKNTAIANGTKLYYTEHRTRDADDADFFS